MIDIVPALGLDAETFKGGFRIIQQALTQGVHLCRARDPEVIKLFVQVARYSIHKQALDVVGEGVRSRGSHKLAAWVLGC